MAEPSSPTYSENWDSGLQKIPYVDSWGELGVFSTLRLLVNASQRCPYFAENHIERLFKHAAVLEMEPSHDANWAWGALNQFIAGVAKHGEYLVRMSMTPEHFSFHAMPRVQPDFSISASIWTHQRENAALKTLDYEPVIDALSEIDRNGHELILQSEDGRLLEGATTNLIFVKGNELVIPNKDCLQGLTLDRILSLLEGPFHIHHEDVFASSLGDFDEIVACGSGKGVVGIKDIAELNWQARQVSFCRKARLLDDNSMIDYRFAWGNR